MRDTNGQTGKQTNIISYVFQTKEQTDSETETQIAAETERPISKAFIVGAEKMLHIYTHFTILLGMCPATV